MTSKTILSALLILLGCASAFGATCSNATLAGNYGFLVTGTAGGNPLAVQGQIVADGSGGLTGEQTSSVNGVLAEVVPVTGSYSINAKCNGSAKLTPQGGTTASFSLTVLSDGRIELVETDSGVVALGFALPQGLTTCPQAINGVYALQESGTLLGQGPVAFGGQITLRSDGTLSGTRSGSVNGTVAPRETISGGYKFLPGCQGGAVISIGHGSPLHFNMVMANGGKDVILIQTDQSTAIAWTLQQ